jgi:hypothetical protein
MSRKIIYAILILFCATAIYAQQDADLHLDRSSGRRIGEFYKAFRLKGSSGLGIGYRHVSFFNSLYYNNVQDAVIKHKGGFELVYFIHIAPVLIDIGYFNSSFDVNSDVYYPDYEKKSTSMYGVEGYISYAPLLPDWGKLSEILTPYIGLGYQTSSLRAKERNEDEKKDKLIGSYGTSSPMWKGGVKVNLGHFFMRGEYRQSLSVTDSKAFNAMSITAGIQF